MFNKSGIIKMYIAQANIDTGTVKIRQGEHIKDEVFEALPDKLKVAFKKGKKQESGEYSPIGDTPEEKIKREALFAKEIAPFKKQIADLTAQNEKLVDEAAKTETLLKAHEENVKNLNAEKEKLTADVEALTKQIADLTAPKVEVKGNVVADAPAKADKPKSGR
jgi:septal ring factor EnvC (AmiA/AmiB activator)